MTADNKQASGGMQLPARVLPIPRSVSVEAQAAMSLPNPFGDDMEPDPADKAAWTARIEAGRAPFESMLAQRYAPFSPASQQVIRLSQADLYEVVPSTFNPALDGKALYYVHGGGFTTGGGIAAALASHQLAHLTGLRTFSIDYRMPPEAPFPAGLEDAIEGYALVERRLGATNVAIFGASAGGGLAASCVLKARDDGLPMPAACALYSPEADLTEAGDSFETNNGIDPVLKRLTNSIALYANGHDLTAPYLSPLFGDFTKGFPATQIVSGTRDLFLSNAVLLHRALRRSGIHSELEIWEAMGHAGFYGMAPEDRELIATQVDFILRHLSAN